MKISISIFLIFLAFLAFANSATISAGIYEEIIDEEWESFKLKHQKSYDLSQDGFRMRIFMENKHRIAQHNILYYQNKTSYKMKINKYGDLLEHEFTGNFFYPNLSKCITTSYLVTNRVAETRVLGFRSVVEAS